ncbi:isoprenoid synthase domain-containing protein [Gorgonomyces haynaldii]|nr:isoprenoid synthase domain-containing protein [Gorgonomyces haynaldii]
MEPTPIKRSPELQKCFDFLNKTSRSFARVIQELDPELQVCVCLFYLVLRALDTIEDDMSIPVPKKQELLRTFYQKNYERGWNFDGNDPLEKDRILLVDYQYVVDQFLALKPEYQETITDITKRMGEGMAEFVGGKKVDTLEDYNLYTHYVAGLVGHGLTRLFVSSGLESQDLIQKLDIANEMGLFLQKTNILKDYLTDIDEGRLFWPKVVWEQYTPKGTGVESLALQENRQRALACLNHLCANALELVPSCLEYLSLLQDPTVLNFCAIPQLMAIASIDLFYNNEQMFTKKANKIKRSLAVKLIMSANSFDQVKQIYYDYAMQLNRKARSIQGTNPFDKSLVPMNMACANVICLMLDCQMDHRS